MIKDKFVHVALATVDRCFSAFLLAHFCDQWQSLCTLPQSLLELGLLVSHFHFTDFAVKFLPWIYCLTERLLFTINGRIQLSKIKINKLISADITTCRENLSNT